MTDIIERLVDATDDPGDTGWAQVRVELLETAAAELAELRATVARLPKTADGVPATPDMELWLPTHGRIAGEVNGMTVNDGYTWPSSSGESPESRIGQCYSTQAAAEASRE